MLAKWNKKLIAISFLLNLIPLGLPDIKKGRLWSMPNPREKWIPPLRSLFNKSPVERHAKREFCAL